MFNKKFVVFALSAIALAACGGNGGSQDAGIKLTYWCPTTDVTYMEQAAAAFKATLPEDKKVEIVCQAVIEEGKIAENLKDLSAAADIALIVDDNVRPAVEGRALVEWTADEIRDVITQSGEQAVSALQVGGKTYGIPYRDDNGYQLIYDSSILSADDVKSVEGLLAAAEAAGKSVGIQYTGGWYNAGFFFAGGMNMGYDENDDFVCDIGTTGFHTMKAMNDLWVRYGGTTLLNTDAAAGFGPQTGGAPQKCAQIIWNAYDTVVEAIGKENVAVAQLPTMNINGVATPLKTFGGIKGISVIKTPGMEGEKLAMAKAFSSFLASDAMQQKRVVDLKQGVCSKAVKAMDIWDDIPFVASLNAQINAGNSVIQASHCCGNWWSNAETLMKNVTEQTEAAPLSEDAMRTALMTCQTAVLA